MKILHILKDGPSALPEQIINVQSQDGQVEVIDLSQVNISYDAVIDAIVSCDKVISW